MAVVGICSCQSCPLNVRPKMEQEEGFAILTFCRVLCYAVFHLSLVQWTASSGRCWWSSCKTIHCRAKVCVFFSSQRPRLRTTPPPTRTNSRKEKASNRPSCPSENPTDKLPQCASFPRPKFTEPIPVEPVVEKVKDTVHGSGYLWRQEAGTCRAPSTLREQLWLSC